MAYTHPYGYTSTMYMVNGATICMAIACGAVNPEAICLSVLHKQLGPLCIAMVSTCVLCVVILVCRCGVIVELPQQSEAAATLLPQPAVTTRGAACHPGGAASSRAVCIVVHPGSTRGGWVVGHMRAEVGDDMFR